MEKENVITAGSKRKQNSLHPRIISRSYALERRKFLEFKLLKHLHFSLSVSYCTEELFSGRLN